MWYLVHVETGVMLSSETIIPFRNVLCFSRMISEWAACIYTCINVSVYVKSILTQNDDDTHRFRVRELFLKAPFCVLSRRLMNFVFFFFFITKNRKSRIYSFLFIVITKCVTWRRMQNYWFIQIRNIMILSQNVQIPEDCSPKPTFSYKEKKLTITRNI